MLAGQKSLRVDISMKIGKNFSYKENVAEFESRIRVEFGCVKAKFSRVRKKNISRVLCDCHWQ